MRGVAAYGPLIAAIVVAMLIASPDANDFFQFWWAGHLVATGRSPYDPASWNAALTFAPAAASVVRNCVSSTAAACLWVYPPWTAWVLAPISSLGLQTGIAIYRLVVAASLAAGGIMWARMASARPASVGTLLFAFGASAASVRDLVTGHFEGALLVGLALVAIGLRDRKILPAVAGASLVALKPHVGLALIPIVAIWLVSVRAYRILAALLVALAALAIAGFMIDPLAWPALAGLSGAKLELGSATTWGAAASIAGVAWPALAALLVGAAIASAAATWRSAPARPEVLVAMATALSLVVALYAQSYDLVLLFPAFALAFGRARPAIAAVAAAAAIVLTWAAYALELAGAPDAIAGLLPTFVLVALALRFVTRGAARLEPV